MVFPDCITHSLDSFTSMNVCKCVFTQRVRLVWMSACHPLTTQLHPTPAAPLARSRQQMRINSSISVILLLISSLMRTGIVLLCVWVGPEGEGGGWVTGQLGCLTRALHGNKCPFGSCQSELSLQSGPGAKRLNC